MSKEKPQEGSCAFRTTIGGQALIEGILMRGPKQQATVVRNKQGGLETRVEEIRMTRDRYPVLGLPGLRGCVNFVDSIVQGTKALLWSAAFFPEEGEPGRFELWLEKTFGKGAVLKLISAFALVAGLFFAIALVVFLPTLLTGGVLYFTPDAPLWLRNLLEGVAKIAIFLVYLALCARLPDIRRTFCYHGAEHKCIFCYERGLPLTVENVAAMPRFHPRCGTSFLFIVIIVSILLGSVVFALPPVRLLAANVFVRILAHLLLLPLVVSLTYELNRLIGRHDTALTRALTLPGLKLQGFTTFEPDEGMIEVAITALTLVLPEKDGADAW